MGGRQREKIVGGYWPMRPLRQGLVSWLRPLLTVSEAAWRSKPSWYLVTTEDGMIPPPAQRSMSERAGSTVEEAAGSHAIYVSQPAAVAALIEKAASEVSSAAR